MSIQALQELIQAATPLQWLVCVGGTVLSYLIGSISFAWIIARRHGVDLREHGSGNLGATNVFRVLGPKAGLTVFALDVLKGLIPALAACIIIGPSVSSVPEGPLAGLIRVITGTLKSVTIAPGFIESWRSLAISYGLAAILGHMFPIYLKFKGGKAVATGCGVFLVLAPLPMATTLLLWTVILMFGRIVSLASMISAVALFLQVLLNHVYKDPGKTLGSTTWLAGLVCALVLFRHRANISRLIQGTEPRLEKPRKKRRRRPARTERPRPAAFRREARKRIEKLVRMLALQPNPARRRPASTDYPGRRSPAAGTSTRHGRYS